MKITTNVTQLSIHGLTSLVWAATLVSATLGGATTAQAVENTIVFIVCDRPSGEQEFGSGVIVSERGDILTANHVVDGNSNCRASINHRDPAEAKAINPRPVPVQLQIDAKLMRFVDQSLPYEFARYCKLEPWMRWRPILVAGFPGGTTTGKISARQGVLSTVEETADGLLETDSLVARGMSGGPVFSINLRGIIGIVVGGKPEATGGIEYEGILPAELYAQLFDLTPTDQPCYRLEREVQFEDGEATWQVGDDARFLGVRPEDGVCFLATVSGVFNHEEDRVGVEVLDEEYVIVGNGSDGGNLTATARCYWNN